MNLRKEKPFTAFQKASILGLVLGLALPHKKGGVCMDDFTRKFNLATEKDSEMTSQGMSGSAARPPLAIPPGHSPVPWVSADAFLPRSEHLSHDLLDVVRCPHRVIMHGGHTPGH